MAEGTEDRRRYDTVAEDTDGFALVRVCRPEDGATTRPLCPSDRWTEEAAAMLLDQWPRGGPVEKYKDKILHPYRPGAESYGLPCSYLLVRDGSCVGHGRLTECFESSGGNAAAATYVVIDPAHRGRRVGSRLVGMLETEAEKLGYHYVYLWTKTAIPFYEKIGYHQCQRVSLKKECLKTLRAHQVEGLEALLVRKRRSVLDATAGGPPSAGGGGIRRPFPAAETIMLPPGDEDHDLPDVWLRKRLVERVGSIRLPRQDLLEQLQETVRSHPAPSSSSSWKWRYLLRSVPWQAQIGPSCGLAALRMVREYSLERRTTGGEEPPQLPSLLGEAQERGYTSDGEVFDAHHLLDLAETVCGLDCEMWSTLGLPPARIAGGLSEGSVFVLPYDSNARTKLPDRLSGKRAHYGIVVGILVGRPNPDGGAAGGVHPGLEVLEDLSLLDDSSGGDDDVFYLLVQHSLSQALSIAPWSEFRESNQQLDTVDARRFGEPRLDLKGRMVLCRGMR